MIMAEFPCPPLPVAGHRLEDSSRAVLNSHDMISALIVTAMKMNDQGFNERRRRRQEELETQYRRDIAKAKTFNEIYSVMSTFTQHYIHSYLLHDASFLDARVLEIDHATPGLRRQIHSFTNASAILAGEMDVSTVPNPPEDFSDEHIKQQFVECAQRIAREI